MARRRFTDQSFTPQPFDINDMSSPDWMKRAIKSSILQEFGGTPQPQSYEKTTDDMAREMRDATIKQQYEEFKNGTGAFDLSTKNMAQEMNDASIRGKYDQFKNPKLQQPISGTSDLSSRIKNMLSTSSQPQEENPLALAGGGPLMPDRMHLVGERGPELIVPNGQGGYHVVPSEQTQQILMQRGMQGITPHAYGYPDIEDPNKTYSNVVMGKVPPQVNGNVVMGNVPPVVNSNMVMGKVRDSANYGDPIRNEVPRPFSPDTGVPTGPIDTATSNNGLIDTRSFEPIANAGRNIISTLQSNAAKPYVPSAPNDTISAMGDRIIGTLQANAAKPYVPTTPNDSLAKIADRFRVGSATEGSEVPPVIGGPPVFQTSPINVEGKGFNPNEVDFDQLQGTIPQAISNVWNGSELQRQVQQARQNFGRMFGGGGNQAQAATNTPEAQGTTSGTIRNPYAPSWMEDLQQPVKADFSFRPEPTKNSNGTSSNAPSHIMEVINGTNRQYARFTPGMAFPQMYNSPEEALAGRSFVQQELDARRQNKFDIAKEKAAADILKARARASGSGSPYQPVKETINGVETNVPFNKQTGKVEYTPDQQDQIHLSQFDALPDSNARASYLSGLDEDTVKRILTKSRRPSKEKEETVALYKKLFSEKR